MLGAMREPHPTSVLGGKEDGLAALRTASLERAGAPSLRGVSGGTSPSPSPVAWHLERVPYVSSDGGPVPRPRCAIPRRRGLGHLPQTPFWGSPLRAGAAVSPWGWHNPHTGQGGKRAQAQGFVHGFCRVHGYIFPGAGYGGSPALGWWHQGSSPFLGSSAPLGKAPARLAFDSAGQGLALLDEKGETSPACTRSSCCRLAAGAGNCPLSVGTPAGEGPVSLPVPLSQIMSLSLYLSCTRSA